MLTLGVAGYFVLSAMVGCYVAYEKGRSQMEGFILGLLFGPLGLLIVACLPTGDNPGTKRTFRHFLHARTCQSKWRKRGSVVHMALAYRNGRP
ncbi:MAG: hypothetical protein ACLQIB_06975 [Isosphaeraceae bacterium]